MTDCGPTNPIAPGTWAVAVAGASAVTVPGGAVGDGAGRFNPRLPGMPGGAKPCIDGGPGGAVNPVIALIAGEKAADVGAIAPGIVGAAGKFGVAVGFGLNAKDKSAWVIGAATGDTCASEAGSASCDAGAAATPTVPGGLGLKPWRLIETAGVPIEVAGPGSAAGGADGGDGCASA